MKKLPKLIVLASFTVWMITFTGCKKDAENPAVTTLAINTAVVSTITTTSAEAGGNVTSTGGAEVISRGVCWSTVHTPTIADNKTTDGNGSGTFTSSIGGLTPNTTYYVRAYATNSRGTAYGPEISFKSNPVIAGSVTFTTLDITNITVASANSGGEITDNGGKVVTEIGVCWGTSVNPTTSNNKTTGVPQANGTFISYIIGLQPSTKYYVRAYAINSAGTDFGNELSFTTSSISSTIFNNGLTYGSVSDIDGNNYKTIQIGTQIWMAENLKTTRYSDSTSIPDVTDNTEWRNLIAGGYSWYDNNASVFKATYGALYNWYAVTDNRNICPTGWHVPSNKELNTLTTYLGDENVAGGKLKEAGTTHWLSPNTGATNETGFTLLPGGMRLYNPEGGNPDTQFEFIGSQSGLWSTTATYNIYAAYIPTYYTESGFYREFVLSKSTGLSVRCLKNN